jgi:excisionase family DNA binding protein
MRAKRLLTIDEAAEQLCLTSSTIRDWRFRRKHLAFVKVGSAIRVSQESIDRLIEQHTIPAVAVR